MLYKFSSFIFCFIFLSASLYAKDLTLEIRKKADHVFQGVDDTIMRINSGMCRISGKTVESSGNSIDDDIMIAFDYRSGYYRFENGKLKKALLTPEFYYEVWHPYTSSVSVQRSSAASPAVTSQFCRVVDIQNIFCFVPVGPHKPRDYQNSELHLKHADISVISYEELLNGLVKVTTVTPPHLVKEHTEYVIDTKNGFTIQNIKRDVGYTFELSWKNINQTWVPVAYIFNSGPKYGNFCVEWKIDWEQVNEKVDPKLFDLEEMLADQEDGALMLSEELGSPPIIIGKVGKGISSINDESSEGTSYSRPILITLGLLMVVVSLVKMYYDRCACPDSLPEVTETGTETESRGGRESETPSKKHK